MTRNEGTMVNAIRYMANHPSFANIFSVDIPNVYSPKARRLIHEIITGKSFFLVSIDEGAAHYRRAGEPASAEAVADYLK